MTDREFDSQSYRMTASDDIQRPEDDFFDRDAAYESWEEQSGSGGGYRRYWVLLALLAIALVGIYLIYNALRPSENTIRLSQTTVIDSRIDELELRLARLEEAASDVEQGADLNNQAEVLDRLSGRINRLENSFNTWVEESTAKKETVKEKKAVSVKPKPKAVPAKKTVAKPKKQPVVTTVKKETVKVPVKPPKPPSEGARFHTVMPGENLYRIGLKYKLTVEQLKDFNNLTTHAIRTGQKLRVSP